MPLPLFKLTRQHERNDMTLDIDACFDELLADAVAGHARFKVYRQFKMYNAPTPNPWLYGRRYRTVAGAAAR
ncbi:MAG TPA: hypothetical protein VF450_26325 [Noviherbaspirillum sp.]|jgi:hypothetical protein